MNKVNGFLFLLFFVVLSGCGNSQLDKLEGEWLCDGEATLKTRPDYKSLDEPSRLFLSKMFGSIKLKFNIKDEMSISDMGGQHKEEKSLLLLESPEKIEISSSNIKMDITFVTDNCFHLVEPEQKDKIKYLVFKRLN